MRIGRIRGQFLANLHEKLRFRKIVFHHARFDSLQTSFQFTFFCHDFNDKMSNDEMTRKRVLLPQI